MKISFIQPENSKKAVLVSDNKIARLEPDDIKNETTDQQPNDSHSVNIRDDIDVASPKSNKKPRN